MQLAPVASPTAPKADPARQQAAELLVEVPVTAMMSAGLAALGAKMSGQDTMAPSSLVEMLFSEIPLDQVGLKLSHAIDGALALEPALEPRAEALRQAATGVVELLGRTAANTTPVEIEQLLAGFSAEFKTAATPLLEAAALLAPDLVKDLPDVGMS